MTTFRNRMAWVLWIFMAIWMAFLCAFTWIVVRDGPPDGYSPATTLAILSFFWIGGLGASWWAASIRLLRVDVSDGGALEIAWRSPFRTERRRVEAAHVPSASLVECRDSDGDPYFVCRVTLADGMALDLAEWHDPPSVERLVDRFNACRRP